MLCTELAPEWIKSEHVEMDGLWRRGALEKVLHSSLDASARIFGSRFHYIERVCQKYGQWNVTPPKTPMMPDTRLTVDDCPEGYVDPHFHAQY